jgi:hypothetical protein
MQKPRRTNKAYSRGGAGKTGPKQMWELACQRCAARAALDLIGAARLPPNTWRPAIADGATQASSDQLTQSFLTYVINISRKELSAIDIAQPAADSSTSQKKV